MDGWNPLDTNFTNVTKPTDDILRAIAQGALNNWSTRLIS